MFALRSKSIMFMFLFLLPPRTIQIMMTKFFEAINLEIAKENSLMKGVMSRYGCHKYCSKKFLFDDDGCHKFPQGALETIMGHHLNSH